MRICYSPTRLSANDPSDRRLRRPEASLSYRRPQDTRLEASSPHRLLQQSSTPPLAHSPQLPARSPLDTALESLIRNAPYPLRSTSCGCQPQPTPTSAVHHSSLLHPGYNISILNSLAHSTSSQRLSPNPPLFVSLHLSQFALSVGRRTEGLLDPSKRPHFPAHSKGGDTIGSPNTSTIRLKEGPGG